ncbi:MAG: PQQ-binding-like beta-propeller repeat protein [Planctomycetota bacterium]|nr:PQQ-binding-like beta-propeller repeat protein [Planctomycetota bacterium]
MTSLKNFRPGCFLFGLSAIWIAFHPVNADNDWKQFRGPGGLGASSSTNLPTQWGDSKNLAWKIKLPGAGSSSPIALGDELFVTCYSGYGEAAADGSLDNLKLHVLCIDRRTGAIKWKKDIQPKLPESKRVRDHGYAGPTPATDGRFLYVFFGKSGVYKFDLKGKQIWNTTVGDGLHGWGCGTSPVLFENLVIVNASVESKSLVAIDQQTGEIVWQKKGMMASWNTPHLVPLGNGKTELVVSVKNQILAFDPKTGKPLWNCQGIQDYVCPSVISQDGVVYAIGGRTSRCLAIKAGGSGDVSKTHLLWEADAGANVSSPVAYKDHLYWVSDRNTTAYCVRMKDGEIVYKERFKSQPYASTVVADGKLYVVTRRGGTFVLSAKPEFEELARNQFEDRTQFNASPIVTGNKLILRSNEYLYCVEKQ